MPFKNTRSVSSTPFDSVPSWYASEMDSTNISIEWLWFSNSLNLYLEWLSLFYYSNSHKSFNNKLYSTNLVWFWHLLSTFIDFVMFSCLRSCLSMIFIWVFWQLNWLKTQFIFVTIFKMDFIIMCLDANE